MKGKLSKGKLALIILASFAFLWGAAFTTDAILAKNEKKPFFALKINTEGVHDTYLGLFYIVYVYEYPVGCVPEGAPCTNETVQNVKIQFWYQPDL